MDVNNRKKRAVLLATIPASLSATFAALSPRMSGHRYFPYVLGLWLLIIMVCLTFAILELAALKREGSAD